MSANNNGEAMPPEELSPRLCHLVKWPDFEGYGFNLHAEKNRSGQYIGKVDEGSPAELAGLREGDRIVEVNGVNISNENHKQVVERIKAVPNETKLLVLDEPADHWFKERKLVVKSGQPYVQCHRTPVPRPPLNHMEEVEDEIMPLDAAINMNGNENNHHINNNQAERNSTDSASLDGSASTPSESKMSEDHLDASNGMTPPDTPQSQKSLSESSNGSAPPTSTPTPPPPQVTTTTKAPSGGGGELNLNMSASQMRELLAQRKRQDPKKAQMDLRQKYEIVQQM